MERRSAANRSKREFLVDEAAHRSFAQFADATQRPKRHLRYEECLATVPQGGAHAELCTVPESWLAAPFVCTSSNGDLLGDIRGNRDTAAARRAIFVQSDRHSRRERADSAAVGSLLFAGENDKH